VTAAQTIQEDVDMLDEIELYVDVAALLDGHLPEPPTPVLLTRTDGHALFYPGRVNVVFGDPEAGKSWVALAACVEALRGGRRVLVMDLDHNGAESVVANLLLLGAPPNALRDRDMFRYCAPEEPGEIHQVIADCQPWRPAVAVVDSIGELLPMLGANSNNADEFTNAHARILKPLAVFGAAVVAIDHLAKNADSRAQGPGGTIAKRRAIGGVAIRVKPLRQFVPGKGGAAGLFVNKDRHGGVRRWCTAGEREPMCGTFVMEAEDEHGAVGWRVVPPLETLGEVGGTLEDKAAQFLSAARDMPNDTFTLAEVAAAVSGEDPPSRDLCRQARHHVEKLTSAGLLEVASKGHRGGSPGRWKVAEIKSRTKSRDLFDEPNSAANSAESQES
jgi:hypothetical protein